MSNFSLVRRASIALLLLAGTAAAEPKLDHLPELVGLGTPCVTVPMPPHAFTRHAGQISSVLYLERCRGGCTINGGAINDARTMTSAIPPAGSMTAFPEFTDHLGALGPSADAEWDALLVCVREVYSYYDVQVTDQKPSAGISYHLNLVSGSPGLIGLPTGTLGISPFACAAQDNIISFSFSNDHRQASATAYVEELCWTATHEAGHAFGLEHAWKYLDNRSACNDPMSYPTGACNPRRFFRGEPVTCGGFSPEPCTCSSSQTSHLKLLSVFGPGTPAVAPPTIAITNPGPSGQLGSVVSASGGSRRGIAKVELLVNGFKWAEVPGAAFGASGQPNPSTYNITVPADLPGGIVDLVTRARDDVGATTDSATVTAVKGAPCTTADACARGQRCDAGRCLWDPPIGEVGDPCTYDQFCVGGMCRALDDIQVCTQLCVPGIADSCPEDLTCVDAGGGAGICFPTQAESGGGCCSSSRDGVATGLLLGIAVYALLAGRRWRRRNVTVGNVRA